MELERSFESGRSIAVRPDVVLTHRDRDKLTEKTKMYIEQLERRAEENEASRPIF